MDENKIYEQEEFETFPDRKVLDKTEIKKQRNTKSNLKILLIFFVLIVLGLLLLFLKNNVI